MYTKINTAHALESLHLFLQSSPLCARCQAIGITVALKIPMLQNVFKLGATFRMQKSGTAMGTSPGENYAKLYYGTWEMNFANYFSASLALSTASTSMIESDSGSIIQTRTSIN
jgi:hypothetical protein